VLARLAALEDKVRKLEGNLAQPELVGTYRWGYLQASIGANPAGIGDRVENNISGGTLTLTSGGVASYSGREIGFVTGIHQPGPRVQRGADPDTFDGTWSYADGVLNLVIGGETVKFVGGVGGRMWYTVTANPLDGTTTLVILAKDL
jgi:hypothetical protein